MKYPLTQLFSGGKSVEMPKAHLISKHVAPWVDVKLNEIDHCFQIDDCDLVVY